MTSPRSVLKFTVAAVLLSSAIACQAAPPPLTRAQSDFFENKIRPILADNCYKCHSAQAQKVKGDLWLDTRQGLLKGGASGPAIVPGHPDKSLLITAVSYSDLDLQMPPRGPKLSDAQIADLTAWIKMGAPDPRVAPAASQMVYTTARDHWAFKPIQNPPVPEVTPAEWVKNPIDAFVLKKLEAAGL